MSAVAPTISRNAPIKIARSIDPPTPQSIVRIEYRILLMTVKEITIAHSIPTMNQPTAFLFSIHLRNNRQRNHKVRGDGFWFGFGKRV